MPVKPLLIDILVNRSNKGARYYSITVVLTDTAFMQRASKHFLGVIPKNAVKIKVFFCNYLVFYYNGVNRVYPEGAYRPEGFYYQFIWHK